MINPPDTINKVKVNISKYGEKIVKNINMPLEYMEDIEPGNSWSDYVTREDLPEVPEEKFTRLTQVKISKGSKG